MSPTGSDEPDAGDETSPFPPSYGSVGSVGDPVPARPRTRRTTAAKGSTRRRSPTAPSPSAAPPAETSTVRVRRGISPPPSPSLLDEEPVADPLPPPPVEPPPAPQPSWGRSEPAGSVAASADAPPEPDVAVPPEPEAQTSSPERLPRHRVAMPPVAAEGEPEAAGSRRVEPDAGGARRVETDATLASPVGGEAHVPDVGAAPVGAASGGAGGAAASAGAGAAAGATVGATVAAGATSARDRRPPSAGGRPGPRRPRPDPLADLSPEDQLARRVAHEYAPDADVRLGRERRFGRRRVTILRTRADRRLLRRIDTWTVFKMSFFFYLLLLVITLLAGIVTWFVAQRIGFIGDIQKSVRSLADDKKFLLHGGPVFEYAALAGVILAVAGTLLNTLGAMLYNLLADLIGGVQTVVITEPD